MIEVNPERFVCATAEFSSRDPKVKAKYEISRDDAQKISNLARYNSETSTIFQGRIYPIRTNKNFLRDFILPTYMNHEIEIENVALRAIATFVWILLDLITLPIRFVVAPFRLIYNVCKTEHPLRQLIREKGWDWDQKLLDAERAKIKVNCYMANPKNSIFEAIQYSRCFDVKYVNFIDVPFYEKKECSGTVSTREVPWKKA